MDEWIEEFYSDLERGLDNYTRPKYYKERALRVLNGKRYPQKATKEGLTKRENSDG